VFGLLSAVFLASVLLPLPTSDGQIAHIPAFCPFYRLTGLPCPGCGLTRAFVCISHGQFAQSLHWHPIGWLVYAGFALLWVREGLTLLLGRQVLPLSPQVQCRLGVAAFVIVFLVGISRIGWLVAHHTHFS
jgi:hypothetical protein